ncbi:MAG: proteasome assembly chaperone family protein [Acidimicrobiia bacterium]
MSLYELHQRPDLDSPVLLVALEGWIDAAGAAAQAIETIVDQCAPEKVATFDADALLDFRARRPILRLEDGVQTGLTWSTTELHAGRAPGGQDVLLLTGAEPDHAWHAFADAVVALSLDLGCRMQVGLGAYPAAAPHTRPVLLSATASTEELAASTGMVRGTIEVPGGVEAVLEHRFAEVGLPAVGVWAQVPHYVAAMRYPAAAARLVEGVNEVAGTDFTPAPLMDEVAAMRTRIDELVTGNPQHLAMIRQMEAAYDAALEAMGAGDTGLGGPLPSGDDLAEELQRFLREQGET